MYWVFNNFFLFFNNFNYFNYFNYFFLFNKNLILNKNQNILPLKFKNNNKVFLKNFNYFNSILIFKSKIIRLTYLDFRGKYKNNKFFSFNNYCIFFLKKALNVVSLVLKSNHNLLFLDNSYKQVFSLYNYIFSLKNLLVYKKYFFISSSFFTYSNWCYYYNKFCRKFNIVLLIILNFYTFNKFFNTIRKTNLPLISLVPITNLNDFVDYPIFVNTYFNLEKFILFNMVSQLIFLNFNYIAYNKKINFLKIFYIFCFKNLK